MREFAAWYLSFLQTLFSHIGKFFESLGNGIADVFYIHPASYIQSFAQSTSTYGALDWIAAIFILAINFILIVLLLIFLYHLTRRYIRFVSKEVNKDDLLNEVSLLNVRLIEITDEKNTILAMKSDELGLTGVSLQGAIKSGSISAGSQTSSSDEVSSEGRFTKLIDVDKTYNFTVKQTNMNEEDKINLHELTQQFINYAASQLKLYYSPKIVARFFAGMAASNLMILEGISGTGKTSLPYAMGKFFKNDSSIISVQPSWRDRAEMIGYLNDFTKRFNETDFLKAIYEATYRTDLNFIILDEMNLARIEYYFADFLSIMEMPNASEWLIDLTPDQLPSDPLHLKNGKLLLPQNIWFIGTANRDDSTFTITDKVYDRASSIEMNEKAQFIDAPYTSNINVSFEYLKELFDTAKNTHALSPNSIANLAKLDEFITQKFQITFGNRIMKQIRAFMPVYLACGRSELEGLDYLVLRKILRKFESLNLPFLQDELEELIEFMNKLYGKDNFTESKAFIESLRKQI